MTELDNHYRKVSVPTSHLFDDTDEETYGRSHVRYAHLSTQIRMNAARVIDLLDEIEPDGCYVGENHTLEAELQALMRQAWQIFCDLRSAGSKARHEVMSK